MEEAMEGAARRSEALEEGKWGADTLSPHSNHNSLSREMEETLQVAAEAMKEARRDRILET